MDSHWVCLVASQRACTIHTLQLPFDLIPFFGSGLYPWRQESDLLMQTPQCHVMHVHLAYHSQRHQQFALLCCVGLVNQATNLMFSQLFLECSFFAMRPGPGPQNWLHICPGRFDSTCCRNQCVWTFGMTVPFQGFGQIACF